MEYGHLASFKAVALALAGLTSACAVPCVDDGFLKTQQDPACSAVSATQTTTTTASTTTASTTTASTTTASTTTASTTTASTTTASTSATTDAPTTDTSTTDALTSTTDGSSTTNGSSSSTDGSSSSTDGSSSSTGGMEPLTVDAGSSVCGSMQSPPMLQAVTMGGDGNYTWSWTPTTDLDDPTSQTPTVTPGGGPTTYTVEVLDGMNNMVSDSVTVHFTDQTLVLDPNVCTALEFPGQGNANSDWQWDPNTMTVCQISNSNGTTIFCPWEFDNATITGTFSVPNPQGDDDFIGLVWGMQDSNHFYLFTWKKMGQVFCGPFSALTGMQVKVIDVKDPINSPQSCNDRLQPADTVNSKLLVPVDQFYDQGWLASTEYLFELTHKNTGEVTIVIRVKADMQLVAMKTFMDTTYLSGKFGVYSESQSNTCFASLTSSCLP